MDTISSEARSENMRRIRGRNTVPELAVRRLLHRRGYRFRLHRKDLPGKPDIVLPRFKTAIFVHGCFWHGHEGCRRSKLPETRAQFWAEKIGWNKQRDARAITALAERGYQSVTIWQCELRDPGAILRRVAEVTRGAA
ncbi:MAG: very short patch repair endonuclease [Sphingosinicella sp.]|uniref:very short patch repair endonuclease n=1 Tax=Sphingosinicella sp. TaxID=1917971 RepID=UPI00403817D1